MVKFGDQYETQKITEWYNSYIDYKALHARLSEYLTLKKDNKSCELPGVYYFSPKLQRIICLNFDISANNDQGTLIGERRPSELPFASLQNSRMTKKINSMKEKRMKLRDKQVE